MKIAILTAYTDTNKWTDDNKCDFFNTASKNHIDYCYKHNYTYIADVFTEDDYNGYHPTWIKILALKKYLPSYDYIVWIDSDCIITDTDITIQSMIYNSPMLVIPKCELDYTTNTVWTGITTGFMICKNDKFVLDLLDTLIQTSNNYKFDYFHEQSVLDDYLRDGGYFDGIDTLYYKHVDDLSDIITHRDITYLPYSFHKYVDDGNCRFIYHAGGSSPTKKSRLHSVLNKYDIKFGIYTSFYNCESFVNNAFTQIESLDYGNFEWHITDDFSTDSTYDVIMKRIEMSPIKHKIKYYTQSAKKEMYWSPNLFFDNTFDWIILVDADDDVNPNFLKVYRNVITESNTDAVLISSDFHKFDYSNNSLHSISYIHNNEPISTKIDKYHPECDYLTNLSYSCFGHLRGFRNLPNIKFEIDDRMAGAEDSYHIFWVNSYGKYLHIPRALYKWNMHSNSESHSTNILPNFNGNFNISLDKLKKTDYGIDDYYNDIYIETSALQSYDFGELTGTTISLWTRNLTNNQIKKLTNLYFDCKLLFNDSSAEIHIICLNYFSFDVLKSILTDIKDYKILGYYQSNHKYITSSQMDIDIDNTLHQYGEVFSDTVGGYSWWKYIRHIIFKVDI
jgi:hypothetical protein